MTYAFLAGKHRKSPRLLAVARELKKNYMVMVAQIEEIVKAVTYPARHRNEWWNRDLTDNQRAWLSMLFGLIYGAILFAALTN